MTPQTSAVRKGASDEPFVEDPAFVAYPTACIVLCTNLMFLWLASAAARAKSKTAINPEDAAQFAYLKRLQPWRTVFFLTGVACLVALLVGVALLLIKAG